MAALDDACLPMSAKCQKRTFQETALYSPSTMNARDFVALIRMAVISFEF